MSVTVIDTLGMFDLEAALPEQAEAAVRDARGIRGLPDIADIQNVVVLGMGGSGVAGDILLAAAAPLMPVPVVVVKSYECPAFVDESSLVFAVSASGNTEETLQAASDAAVAGARIVAVTGGGELAHLADRWGAPLIGIPTDIPQPRAAIGALSLPPLVVLEDIGLFRGADYWINATIDQLKARRDELAGAGDASAAAAIARRLAGTVPIIQGGSGVGAAAAGRWRTQINENAKAPAFSSAQPELCHNEVCGWGQHQALTRSALSVVNLRHDGEHPQVSRRFELVGELLAGEVADVIEVAAQGDGDLAQLFDLVMFGDYVSLWMAAEAGIDPGPVDVLAGLKRRLAGS